MRLEHFRTYSVSADVSSIAQRLPLAAALEAQDASQCPREVIPWSRREFTIRSRYEPHKRFAHALRGDSCGLSPPLKRLRERFGVALSGDKRFASRAITQLPSRCFRRIVSVYPERTIALPPGA